MAREHTPPTEAPCAGCGGSFGRLRKIRRRPRHRREQCEGVRFQAVSPLCEVRGEAPGEGCVTRGGVWTWPAGFAWDPMRYVPEGWAGSEGKAVVSATAACPTCATSVTSGGSRSFATAERSLDDSPGKASVRLAWRIPGPEGVPLRSGVSTAPKSSSSRSALECATEICREGVYLTPRLLGKGRKFVER